MSADKGAFRVKDWWWSKAALLMGMVYLFTLWFGIHFKQFIPLALLSLCTIAGFASMGYLLNDLFDMKQDMLSVKRNFLIAKPFLHIITFFLLSSAFIFLPWIILPASSFSYLLITFELYLFLIYSVPPVRLKERGMAGIVVDALYAHAVPVGLAAYTFSLAAGVPLPRVGLLLLFTWQFASGIRNILLHQLTDAALDKHAGVKNFVATMSNTGFSFSLKYLIITELLSSLAFFVFLTLSNTPFVACVLVIIISSITVLRLFYNGGIPEMLASKWKYYPNILYEKWLPPLFLLILCTYDKLFIPVLLLHLALFNFDFYIQLVRPLYAIRNWGRIKLRILWKDYIFVAGANLVNYSIYYALRLFGINLKRENTSALSYFKKRWGKS